MVKVRNMTSKNTGKEVANQFIIETDDAYYFQSYSSIIACVKHNAEVTLDENKWNYSRTTSKYRNQFLAETTKETEANIKSGQYKLLDLN